MTQRRKDQKQEGHNMKIFPVPFTPDKIIDNITISTDNSFNTSKVQKKDSNIPKFTIPFTLDKQKENLIINNNRLSKFSKEQIINQAINFHLEGNIQEASKYYKYCINHSFSDHIIFSNYGVILKGLGKLKEAEAMQRKSINIKPDFADAYYNLGNTMIDLNKLKKAESCYRKAIKLRPDYAKYYNNLGNLLLDLGRAEEAEESQRKAIQINPDFALAHCNLGTILKDLGKLKEAEISTRKAIELNPTLANAHNNLGIILKNLGKLDLAEISIRKAIDISDHFADAYCNLGTILKDLGKLNQAELSIRKAIKLKPDFYDAYFNLALIELIQENYKSGLDNYEYRFKKIQPVIILAKPKIKRFKNSNLNKLEKLLIVCEQGLGDTLQYMRYIPHLRNQGFDISFCAQKKLHSLIKSSGIDPYPLTPEQANQFSQGKWIPLLSLPKYLKVNPENPIVCKPYIFSKPELKQKWKNTLSTEKKPIIGINWQGNKEMEKTYQGRSIPLETFSILLNQAQITMLSLQKGFGSEQLEKCSFKNKFVECQKQIDSTWDFLENAAIIDNCDLIITCDTSIAHLAGGMGKKVWLLLKYIPFWTWGVYSESTFWYPSMRLFRQKEKQSWQEVMNKVSTELNKELR